MKKDQVVVVGCNADTAVYTVRPATKEFEAERRSLPEELAVELDALKAEAQDINEMVPTRWWFGSERLLMQDKGGSHFKWIIRNNFLSLAIGTGKKTGLWGQCRVSSEYLWKTSDLGKALNDVSLFLFEFFGQFILIEQSGLDLAVDLVGFDFGTANIKEHFLSRATLDDERPEGGFYQEGPDGVLRRWKRVTGLPFGKRTAGVSALIYDKTNEIKYQSPEKGYMLDIWGKNAVAQGVELPEDLKVWRVELRFKRAALREFPDVSGAFDVLDHIADLWAYGVGHVGGNEQGLPDGWLRFVEPAEDTNRSRWPVHAVWKVIQTAFALHFEQEPLPPGEFIREKKREVNVERGVQQMLGWFSTMETWRELGRKSRESYREVDISAPVGFLVGGIGRYMEKKGVVYEELVKAKCDALRKRKRVQPLTDRQLGELVDQMARFEAWRQQEERDKAFEGLTVSETAHYILKLAGDYMQKKQLDFGDLVAFKSVKNYREIGA